MRATHTYSTTNIVLLDGAIYAEDFSHVTQLEPPERIGKFVDREHVRKFVDCEGSSAMYHFTMWLQEQGAVADLCWVLGPELTDKERQP